MFKLITFGWRHKWKPVKLATVLVIVHAAGLLLYLAGPYLTEKTGVSVRPMLTRALDLETRAFDAACTGAAWTAGKAVAGYSKWDDSGSGMHLAAVGAALALGLAGWKWRGWRVLRVRADSDGKIKEYVNERKIALGFVRDHASVALTTGRAPSGWILGDDMAEAFSSINYAHANRVAELRAADPTPNLDTLPQRVAEHMTREKGGSESWEPTIAAAVEAELTNPTPAAGGAGPNTVETTVGVS